MINALLLPKFGCGIPSTVKLVKLDAVAKDRFDSLEDLRLPSRPSLLQHPRITKSVLFRYASVLQFEDGRAGLRLFQRDAYLHNIN